MSTSSNVGNKARYPVLIFLLLLAARVVYLLLEGDYHVSVLDFASNPDATNSDLNSLSLRGHLLAAIGATIFLFPIIFYIARRSEYFLIRYPVLIILMALSTLTVYVTLDKLLDKIVADNYQRAYEAYYVNIFKFGLLKNEFTYKELIDKKHISKRTLTVEDRVKIANIFLITQLDSGLVDRVIEVGTHKFAQIYTKRNEGDYMRKRSQLKTGIDEITKSYDQIHKARLDINKALFDANKDRGQSYTNFMKEVDRYWIEYSNASHDVNKKIEENTSLVKIDEFEKNLTQYFRYKNNAKAQQQYRDSMQKNFGRPVDPNVWCYKDTCPTRSKIKEVITAQISGKFEKSIAPLPVGLNKNAFMFNPHLLNKMGNETGLSIDPANFRYRKGYFLKLYDAKVEGEKDKYLSTLHDELKKAGLTAGDVSISWSQFVRSKAVENRIRKRLPDIDQNSYNQLIEIIESKDLTNFKNDVYIPNLAPEVRKRMYSRQDFTQRDDLIEIGTDAIKALYIPPFAVTVSLISILLNGLALLYTVSFLFLFFLNREVAFVLISAFVLFLLYAAPIYVGFKDNQYKTPIDFNNLSKYRTNGSRVLSPQLHQELQEGLVENKKLAYYVGFIEWSLPYEKLIYSKMLPKS